MAIFEPFLLILLHRAQTLVPLLAIAFCGGEFIAQFCGVDWLLARMHRAARYLLRKLDRSNRSIATRVYRGIVAVLMLVGPALIVGLLLSQPNDWVHIAGGFVIVALLGHAFASIRLLNTWRAAQAHTLPLELPERDYLFVDSHAVLRYLILDRGEQFAVGIIGACFWFVLGGMPLLLGYLTLALLAQHFRTPAFGWAANALFRLLDIVPRALTTLFLTLGALFIPGAKPLAVFRAHSFPGVLSYLLNISLGGRLPDRELAWVGTGTPKLQPEHLARFLLLRVAATVVLILALSAENIIKLFNTIN